MIEKVARLAAREMGVPPSYLGFDSINPTSADAINAAESALIKRADERVRQLKRTYKKLGTVTLAVAGRERPENWNEIDSVFRNTQVVTPSASADRLSKNVAVGLYEKEYPDFVYRELGMSPAEIVEIKAIVRKNGNTNIINRLTEEG
jgi:SAM-dependent methyltransferase